MPRQLTEETIICLYRDNKWSGPQIADAINYPIQNIYKVLKENEIEVGYNRNEKYKLNFNKEAFFEINNRSAYWVGFIMADGHIRKEKGGKKPALSVQLARKDKNHLKKFKEFMDCEQKISTSGNSCSIEITSRKLVNSLGKYGIKPNKTFTAEVKQIENNCHFWRGVVDGDGSLHVGTADYAHLDLYGARKLLSQFSDYVRKIYPKWKGDFHEHKNIYKVGLHCTAARKTIENLYKNGIPVLDRKKEIAEEIF